MSAGVGMNRSSRRNTLLTASLSAPSRLSASEANATKSAPRDIAGAYEAASPPAPAAPVALLTSVVVP